MNKKTDSQSALANTAFAVLLTGMASNQAQAGFFLHALFAVTVVAFIIQALATIRRA